MELPISTQLSTQSLTFRAGDVEFARAGAATVTRFAGVDYVQAQFTVKNVGTSAFDHLTLMAVSRMGNQAGTAVRSVTAFGGTALNSVNLVTPQVTPTHPVQVTGNALDLVEGATDFQAFTVAEVTSLSDQNGWHAAFPQGAAPLNYGFVASRCAPECTRTIQPGESGTVNVAVRLPNLTAKQTYGFVMTFALVNDSVPRVTRSEVPMETAEEASTRLTALGVTTGGEVMSIGEPPFTPTPDRTDVSTASLTLSEPLITTFAGSATQGFSGDGGAATSASLTAPVAVTVDADGNLYIADNQNHRVRKVATDGTITTVAGYGFAGFAGDGGPATAAKFVNIRGLACDTSGNLYISDGGNNRIRKVNTSGTVTTIAGTGVNGSSGDGGPATSAQMQNPMGLAFDRSGNLYVAEYGGNRIRRISPSGIITTVAGNGNGGYAGDGGPATSAQLENPKDVDVDASGNIYIADSDSDRVRKVDTSGVITTIAGNGTNGYSGDGGPATNASLFEPSSVAVDASGNVYIADSSNHRVRRVDASGTITTVAGTGAAGYLGDLDAASRARLNVPYGLALDAAGNLHIAEYGNNRVRKVFLK